MMNNNFMLSIGGTLTILVWVILLGCTRQGGEGNRTLPQTQTGAVLRGNSRQMVGRCTLPPKTFQESDLVGIWKAAAGTSSGTILVLKEDSTYQQIYNDPVSGRHFESDWQKWWIELRDSGIPNLHLQGMRMCDSAREDCLREGGGGGSWLWFDFCENRVIQMHGEVIFLILGVPEKFLQPPRGIELHQLLADPDTTGSVFTLQQ